MENRNEPIAGQTMAAKIAERIRDDIIRRSIPPGSRITVKEIADRYGVSSMPVREAFNMLGGEQLLRLNPYRGATVMAVTSDLMTQLNDSCSTMYSPRWKAFWWNSASKKAIPRTCWNRWRPSTGRLRTQVPANGNGVSP